MSAGPLSARFKEIIANMEKEGDRILVIGDFNENCQRGNIQKMLLADDLGIKDVIKELTKRKAPPTWIQRNKTDRCLLCNSRFQCE